MTTISRTGSGDRVAALYGPALWTVAGFVLYILGGIATLFAGSWLASMVLAPAGIDAGSGTLGLSIRNGIHALTWGLVTAGAAVPLGRRLVPGISFGLTGSTILVAGLVLAASATLLVNEFVRSRYGVYDPEYAGLTVFTGPALVAVALATWATLAVPREGILVPAAVALTAAVGLALTLLPSIPGAADGVAPSSMPLVLALATAAAYGAVAGVVVVRRAAPGVRAG